jgi:AhpD family alkylhydroperoxidase
MPRAPRIAPLPEHEWDDQTRALIQTNWFSDRPTKGQNFFKTMVRHRELFRVWNEFGRVAFNGRLPDRDRELLILRTAWLTRCGFEWAYHQPLVERLGMSAEEIERITAGPDARGWSELDAALLRAVDELHASADISDATWAVLRAHYGEAELIEIPVVVGQYHLVAFFNNAMGVEVDPQLPALPQRSNGPEKP